MATYTVTDEELTHTLYAITKELKDQNTYALPFIDEHESIHGKGNPNEEGGTKLIIPVNFGRHSTTQQLTTGYEPLDFTVEDVGTPGQAEWGLWIQPVVVSNKERRINRGAHKVIDLVESRAKAANRALLENFHKRIFGLAAGDVMSDMLTLNGDDYSTGFFESVAAGSQTNTVVNLSKTTYQSSLGWQNQFVDVAGSFSASGLPALDTALVRIKSLKGDLSKHRIYASLGAFSNLKRGLRSNERYISQDTLDGGKVDLAWDGIRILINRDMPNAGTVTGVANQEWSFLFVDHECNMFKAQKGEYFRSGEFKERDGYDVTAAGIYLMGQTITDELGTSAIIRGADTW